MNQLKLSFITFFNKFSDRCSFVIFIAKIAFFSLLLLFCILAGSYKLGKPLLYFNNTSSAPRGIYIASFDKHYDYDDFYIVRLDRDYNLLKKGTFLLKQIKGKPGDIYISQYDHLDLNGHRYLIRDDKRLPHMPYGSYRIQDDYYMMLNERDDSFDGRYIGPTKQDYLVQEVWLLVNRDYLKKKKKALLETVFSTFPLLKNYIIIPQITN